jgi:hypothetical protein
MYFLGSRVEFFPEKLRAGSEKHKNYFKGISHDEEVTP